MAEVIITVAKEEVDWSNNEPQGAGRDGRLD